MILIRRREIVGALVLSLILVPSARAEIKDSSRDGFTLENSVQVPTDAASTWKALVEDVDKWWPKSHSWWGAEGRFTIEARAGGCFCERAGERQAVHLLVTFVDPGKLLRLTGGLGPLQGMGLSGVLEVRFAPLPAGGGTRVTFFLRAGGYTPDDLSQFAPVVDKVQALQLGGLADYLRQPAPAR